MSARHDNADGPEDIDAAFAEIVAGIEQEAPRWPEGLDAGGSEPADRAPRTSGPATSGAGTSNNPRDWAPPRDESTDEDDEGHFEPPEPPPLPTPRAGTIGGFALISAGLLLLLVPGLAGAGATFALPLGLISISGGICWLLFRLRQGPPPSEDEGAQV